MSTIAETGSKARLNLEFFKWFKKLWNKFWLLFTWGKSVFANLTENLNASAENKIMLSSAMNIPGSIISI